MYLKIFDGGLTSSVPAVQIYQSSRLSQISFDLSWKGGPHVLHRNVMCSPDGLLKRVENEIRG